MRETSREFSLETHFYTVSPEVGCLLSVGDGVGQGGVCDRLLLALAVQKDISHGEPLSQFQESGLRDQIGGDGLSKEVDVEVGGYGQRHRT